jgi:hypothetical protein
MAEKTIWDVLDEEGEVDVIVTREDGTKFPYHIYLDEQPVP